MSFVFDVSLWIEEEHFEANEPVDRNFISSAAAVVTCGSSLRGMG